MRRFGLVGLVCAVSLLGACNDNDGGSNFGIPSNQLGAVNLIIGTSPSCVGGINDGSDCSPNSDCEDAFCTLLCTGTGDDAGRNCTSDDDCIFTCDFGCDRGPDDERPCSQNTDCVEGTCTSALIHDFEGVFASPTDDEFAVSFATSTDSDGDGFTPTVIVDNASTGDEGRILVDFLDGTEDCVTVTWGPQAEQVFSGCGDPVEATFAFPQ